ncbi:ATP-binding protein [Brevibacillus sp. 1238]|uniref:ATP-binding protein n=1 Tax=Brevibacillus sp. 1238 TaxID=2940565 RepID=UPI002476C3E1|nr:ATP-binding protein [Brevibacillus sp. 1238]MDH6351949.1 ABC-type transporter Mla MlaB component/signal transduction histidine kinase [Brevibacillus sp. 1238]
MDLVLSGSLDRNQISKALASLQKANTKTVNNVDLTGVTFAQPYGMVLLLQLFGYLSITNDILLPNNKILSYMARANFFSLVQKYAYLDDNILRIMDQTVKDDGNKSLLEITRIEDNSDIKKTVQAVFDQAYNILKYELLYDDDDVSSFLSLLIELLQNIPRHSESYGYVCAQRYHFPKSDLRYISVCISDKGIGIKESLTPTHGNYMSVWDDSVAINLAVLEGESSKSRGGLGYKGAREIVKKFSGTLYVRSGTADIFIKENGIPVINGGLPFFPGTQIEIILPQKND